MRTVGPRLDGAPVGSALRAVAAALPGGELDSAASEEAAEWGAEMAELGAVCERWGRLLESAVEGHRRIDMAGVRGLQER